MPLKVYPLDQKGANVRVDYGDVSGAGAVGGGCRGGRPPYLVRMKAAPEAEQGYITRPPCRAGQKGYEMAECEGEDTPESYMMLACLICWLCNPPFGIAALYFSSESPPPRVFQRPSFPLRTFTTTQNPISKP